MKYKASYHHHIRKRGAEVYSTNLDVPSLEFIPDGSCSMNGGTEGNIEGVTDAVN